MTKYINIRIPESHWRQLVSDYEDMCGVGEEEDVTVASAGGCCHCGTGCGCCE